jgi:hypothetical protein
VSLSSRRDHSQRDHPGAQGALGSEQFPSLGSGLLVLFVALAPALGAVWLVPWFVTQDGPAHVYNARILVDSVGAHGTFGLTSPWRGVYTVRWQPIPNWSGPIALAALVANLPAWVADRIMTSLTLVGFAAAIFWLRWRVAGARGPRVAALLATLLAMNMAWLFGFASFMLGACLFPVTLGVWWSGRDRLTVGRLVSLAALLALGYFCHLVSLGLTVLSLIVLAVAAPLPEGNGSRLRHRLSRLALTSASFLPLFALAGLYFRIAQRGGPMKPVWENLTDPLSSSAWVKRVEWVDPLSLVIRDGLPWSDRFGPQYVVFAPVIWLTGALVCWWLGRISGGASSTVRARKEGWLALAALLIVGGVIGPDSLGASHGQFLPQRVVLLGLVALVPIFDVDLARWPGRVATAALLTAVTLQSMIIWDYARYSDRTAGQLIRARDAIGSRQRIVTLLVSTKSRFRANPLLHAEDWLGVDTGNVVWNNYETVYYYFPVQFRPEIERPHPGDLEWVSIHESPSDAEDRRRAWEQILSRYAGSIDVVVVWKSDPDLDAITVRWFDQVERRGDVRIFRRNKFDTLNPNRDTS